MSVRFLNRRKDSTDTRSAPKVNPILAKITATRSRALNFFRGEVGELAEGMERGIHSAATFASKEAEQGRETGKQGQGNTSPRISNFAHAQERGLQAASPSRITESVISETKVVGRVAPRAPKADEGLRISKIETAGTVPSYSLNKFIQEKIWLERLRQPRAELSVPSARVKQHLRDELTQVAAVAIAWLESLEIAAIPPRVTFSKTSATA